jgi:hypothetical protein
MPVEFLPKYRYVEVIRYELTYLWREPIGKGVAEGFTFPCTRRGNVKLSAMTEDQKADYFGCTEGDYADDVVFLGVSTVKESIRKEVPDEVASSFYRRQ